MQMDDKTARLTSPPIAGLRGAVDLNIAAWLYLPSAGIDNSGRGNIFNLGRHCGVDFWLNVVNDAAIQLLVNYGSSSGGGATSWTWYCWSRDTWFHLAIVVDGSGTGDVKFYRDGLEQSISTGQRPFATLDVFVHDDPQL